MTATAQMGAMFGVSCSNCGADADVDVEVMAVDTGEVVRDVYACESCASEIQVGAGFHVAAEAL